MMKYPDPGKVKMRLAQSIGEEAATDLYRAFIQDTITTVQSLDIPYHIAVHPPDSQYQFSQWFGLPNRIFRQIGMNLGERLQNCFETMFKKKYQQVIAIASDSPDLPVEILQEAVSSLQTNDVVIGPASDGGYYLIGFSHESFTPEVFVDISWSTETVLRETLERIKEKKRRVQILSEWGDIDTKKDLRDFYTKYQNQTSETLHSMKYLRNHPHLLQILFS